jgi:hypothetical protein
MFGQTKPSQAALIAFATDEIEPQSVTLLDPILKENFEDSTKATNVKLVNQNSFMRCLKAESDTILRCKIPSTEHLNYFNVQLKHLFLPENTIYNYYTLPTLVFQFRDKEGNYLYESTVKPHLLTGNSAYSIWSLGTPNICQAIELNMPIHRRGRATELLIFTDNPARHPSYIDDLIVKTAR